MFVVRPKHIRSTPQAVAHSLKVQTRFYPNKRYVFDYRQDFLMAAVHPESLRNTPPEYNETFAFQTRNKYGQRQTLGQYVAVPAAANGYTSAATLTGEQFVVRPLRHSGGMGYRVTGDRTDFVAGTEYISELYPKRREYRVIFVFGEPLIHLRKKPNDGVDEAQPWGHANSRFQTINDVPGSRLARTDCVARLSSIPAVKGAHIVAADILFNAEAAQPYVCLELNFCPGLLIETNLEKVVTAIRNRG